MLNSILTKIIGSKNERELNRIQPLVDTINALEPQMQALSDSTLRDKRVEFIRRYQNGESLDDLLVEAFAVVREAARRTLEMRHFDVQLVGGIVLHQGKIAEMKTGEGKTLVATLPVFLNALTGRGVHVVTVNDYLAKRDSEWMGSVYKFLGMSVGVIQHDMGDEERKAAYAASVTYGTNNEFGFDYLRDNMKFTIDAMVQRGHYYAIVDEVDSILIDEARTPLIISGPAEESTDKYYRIDKIIPKLKTEEDYQIDEKAKTATLTEDGVRHTERLLGVDNLYDPVNMETLHHVNQALKAHALFRKDVDYMVKDGEVIIVDEFTGRLMPGRRWSDGLHQAIEAKEGVRIERENQTLATITFQNYFRMYEKLAGMTGTADTEAVEFDKIYDLEVMVIPTNRPLIRTEYPDVIYRTEEEKFEAVEKEIEDLHKKGRPVLVGTISIEKSERLSSMLKKKGIRHVVLNAKYHEMEAAIVAQAGRMGAVTIATNMAGRGTDILLGGNPAFLANQILIGKGIKPLEATSEQSEGALKEAKAVTEMEKKKVIGLGGLHILGTERHEARRIDNQLRGRAGRQGDPGSSRFYISLEDDLMRIFGGERLKNIMGKLGMERDVPIEHNLITRSIERAQKQVEAHNFEIRKHLLEYDDVMNKQRVEIYRLRRELLEGKEQRQYVMQKAEEILEWLIDDYLAGQGGTQEWELDNFRNQVNHYYAIDIYKDGVNWKEFSLVEIKDAILKKINEKYELKEKRIGEELMRQHERYIILSIIDSLWKDHLLAMDHLKEGIGLRAYGQRDPLVEYKRESFEMFAAMKARIEDEIIRYLFLLEPLSREEREEEERKRRREQESIFRAASQSRAGEIKQTVVRKEQKVGRNAPCPCGSGKKYKKCCGT
ncbi:MAG: preprotein translocase subunit SecA [Acidobacteriota bacterium]